MEKAEQLPLLWILSGAVLVAEQANIAVQYGIWWGQAAFFGGFGLLAFGPMAQAFFLEVAANRHNALGASVEPWMNGKRTIFLGERYRSVRIPNPDNPKVPRFFSKVPLARPYFRCKYHGVQKYVYMEHNLGLGNRFLYGKGKGNFMGTSVTLRGIDGNVVLSEHPVSVVDDFKKVCVFDLKRAGQDWFIENGDTLPEEAYAVEAEHVSESELPASPAQPEVPAEAPLIREVS